jgi:prepilin-type N-terminal cleavage/methylation domain-containing protein
MSFRSKLAGTRTAMKGGYNMKRKVLGFTLVEILIVVVILGILAAIVVPQFADATEGTYDAVAKSFHRSLISGISVYLVAQKKYPPTFWSWVAADKGGSSLNAVVVDDSLRAQLANPTADVLSGDSKTITLNFKNGLAAVYTIGDNGRITAAYTGP